MKWIIQKWNEETEEWEDLDSYGPYDTQEEAEENMKWWVKELNEKVKFRAVTF